MNEQDSWHDQDAFWELFGPILFNQQRRSSARSEIDRIVKLVPIEGQDRILDLCCGMGRHSLELARRGFDVIGVDRTTAYIEQARQEAEQGDLTVNFIVGDMREYCVPDRFDVVMNLFGSFGYFEDPEDDRRVVSNMYSSLRTGGRFLIETMGKEILARDFQARDWSEEGEVLLLSERRISQDWRRVETRWIAIEGGRRIEHEVSVRSYSAVELSSLLLECGFSKVQVYGDLDGADYDQAAKRLVVLGSK